MKSAVSHSVAEARQPVLPSSALALHVLEGLTEPQKRLSSLYFYDDEGSRLFKEIMALPEYYLTRSEREVLQIHGSQIVEWMLKGSSSLELVELGSGDGSKTIELVAQLRNRRVRTTYYPLDISSEALGFLKQAFRKTLPDVEVIPTEGNYFERWPQTRQTSRQVGMFLGSNLGNLTHESAVSLLRGFRFNLRSGDGFLLGVDLKKSPHTVLAAYSDAAGVTARFNLNLLARLNRELEMDFDLSAFRHYATYSPLDGVARSFLVSTKAQTVTSRVLARSFHFADGESLYTEQSRKYDTEEIERLAAESGFTIDAHFKDSRGWYDVVAWRAVDIIGGVGRPTSTRRGVATV